MMHTKAAAVHIKATAEDGLGDGQFEAIVAVFGNVDTYGDMMVLGAFEETLQDWAKSGDPIPVWWAHQMSDPDLNLGWVLEAKELAPGDPGLPDALKDNGGLWVKGQLDLESPKAQQVYRLMKGRRVTQFSFAYDVIDYAIVKHENETSIWELRKVRLHEVGPCAVGVNQETDLLAVKALRDRATRSLADVKAGRVLSSKNESTLRSAQELLTDATKAIGEVLSALDSEPDDSKATASAEPSAASTPDGAKSQATPHATVEMSAIQTLELELLEAQLGS